MYLAGALILLLCILTVVGTLISDLLLAWLDPRIRYGESDAPPTVPIRRPRRARRRPGLAMAADVVAVPPPPAGHGRRRRDRC